MDSATNDDNDRSGEEKKSFVDRLRGANQDCPLSYLEFREAEYKIAKERREVVKTISARIRDVCRAEIDEYVNCCSEKSFIIYNCRNESKELHKCIRHYQKDALTPEAQRKVMEERIKSGESCIIPSYKMKK